MNNTTKTLNIADDDSSYHSGDLKVDSNSAALSPTFGLFTTNSESGVVTSLEYAWGDHIVKDRAYH